MVEAGIKEFQILQVCKKNSDNNMKNVVILVVITLFFSNIFAIDIKINTKKLPLNHQLFKDKVIILEGLKSSTVTIKSDY